MPEHTHEPFHFDPEVPVPLPAAEIRRRGDRRRRRTTALAVAGAVAAVAAIATPIAVVAGGSDDAGRVPFATSSPAQPTQDASDPVPSPSPSDDPTAADPGAAATIPDDFPLAAGLPATNDDDQSPVRVVPRAVLDRVEACERYWTPTEPVAADDVAGAEWRAEAEGLESRTLALYPSPDDAARAYDAIVTGLDGCPETTSDDGVSGSLFAQVGSKFDGADDHAVYTHRFTYEGNTDTGLEVWQFVRVGPALYLSSSYGEGGGSDGSIAAAIDQASEQSQPVFAALLGAYGAGTSAPGEEGPVAATDQDLLQVEDLPEQPSYTGAWETSADDTLTWSCRPQGFSELGADASVAVRYEARLVDGVVDPPGDVMARVRSAVLQFPDPDAARAAYEQAAGYLDDCGRDQGYGTDTDPADVEGAGEAAHLAGVIYPPDEPCDCDAATFDYQGVVLNGDRLALVAYAKGGGPLRPEGIRAEARALLSAAASRTGL